MTDQNCEFSNGRKGTTCDRCGYSLKLNYPTAPFRHCQQSPCSHLGEQREREGIPLTIRCSCNGKLSQVELPLHNCDRFKRCLPTFRPTDEQREGLAKHQSDATLFKWCCDCELNPINQPQPA